VAAGPGVPQVPGPDGRPGAECAGADAGAAPASVLLLQGSCRLLWTTSSRRAAPAVCRPQDCWNSPPQHLTSHGNCSISQLDGRPMQPVRTAAKASAAPAALHLDCGIVGSATEHVTGTAGPAAAGGRHAAVWRFIGQSRTALPGASSCHVVLQQPPAAAKILRGIVKSSKQRPTCDLCNCLLSPLGYFERQGGFTLHQI
jgi:hypothetical protein